MIRSLLPNCLVAGLLLRHTNAFYMTRMPKDEFARRPGVADEKPVVVEAALSMKEADQWLQKCLSGGSDEEVMVMFGKDQSQAFLPLKKATELAVEESSHEDPIYIGSFGKASSPSSLLSSSAPPSFPEEPSSTFFFFFFATEMMGTD